MQPTEQQVQRSLDALRTRSPDAVGMRSPDAVGMRSPDAVGTRSLDAVGMDGTRLRGAERWSGDVCRLDDLPTEVFTRLLETPALRSDRLERARRRLARGDTPTAEDLAERMIGRLVCDRLR